MCRQKSLRYNPKWAKVGYGHYQRFRCHYDKQVFDKDWEQPRPEHADLEALEQWPHGLRPHGDPLEWKGGGPWPR